MNTEQQEVAQFVMQQTPFNQLDSAACEYFVNHLDIIYLTRENQNQWLSSDNLRLFLIRSGDYDLVDPKGDVITKLSSGDYFGFPSLKCYFESLRQLTVKENQSNRHSIT